jgi:formate--tetrahydrofolate ligase
MATSIEIAQHAELRHMRRFMEDLDLTDEDFEFYGKYTGKIRLRTLRRFADRPNGTLILVTAMTPTPHGEGKTLTSIGMGQALGRMGENGMIALREPSLGPVFGIKGGAAGGGYAQLLPMERINLHFNGDLPAISSAHNLLAALLDNHITRRQKPPIKVTDRCWNRVVDMNDRALRNVVLGLGGRSGGVPRESGFIITAASEVMAILALAESGPDLKRRLGDIVVGYTPDGDAVTARDLDAAGAMTILLHEAIMPNLVQTMEHTPALVHAGPFANIAHGTSSVLAARIARKLSDVVITESGFGADLGAEKFFHIVARQAPDLWPQAVVLVVTCRAMKHHGGVPEADIEETDPAAMEAGLENMEVHIRNLQKFGVPVVVGINRFAFDDDVEIDRIRERCETLDVPCAVHSAFAEGGAGAVTLTETALAAAQNGSASPTYLYDLQASIEEKIRTVATDLYRADGIQIQPAARAQIHRLTRLGYDDLPICVAKTQASLSDDRSARGVPKGWTLTVTDVELSAGAGFLVVVCGNMMRMPGLGAEPAAVHMDVTEDGEISGLF